MLTMVTSLLANPGKITGMIIEINLSLPIISAVLTVRRRYLFYHGIHWPFSRSLVHTRPALEHPEIRYLEKDNYKILRVS